MNMYTKMFLSAIFLIVIVYIYTCESHEDFVSPFPPNTVGSGDFGIEQPGAIADQGSFAGDMEDYVDGHTYL